MKRKRNGTKSEQNIHIIRIYREEVDCIKEFIIKPMNDNIFSVRYKLETNFPYSIFLSKADKKQKEKLERELKEYQDEKRVWLDVINENNKKIQNLLKRSFPEG